ncbi:MAG TPA: hypothetical protein VL200_09845 [Lacunisphaera sp.]|jgi:hypothetical protein|nr:hypothetical protein [Lacunisphaera sp.]
MANQTVGQLNIQMNLELAKMQAQIDSANARVAAMARKAHGDVASMARNMNAALGTIGLGLSFGGLLEFGKSILKLGDDINDLSAEAGLSTDAFQKLAEAGLDYDVSMEDIVKMSTKLRVAIQAAQEGNKQFAADFADLGINVAALKRLAPEQQFEIIGRQIANAADKEKAFREGIEILGARSGPQLIAFLKELGTTGLDKMAAGFDGIRLSKDQLDSLDRGALLLKQMWTYAKLLSAQAVLGTGHFLSEAGKMLAQGEGIMAGDGTGALKAPAAPSSPAAAASTNAATAAQIAYNQAQEDELSTWYQQQAAYHNAASSLGLLNSALAENADKIGETKDALLQAIPAVTLGAAKFETSQQVLDDAVAAQIAAEKAIQARKVWLREVDRSVNGAAENLTSAFVDAINGVEGAFGHLSSVIAKELEAIAVKMLIVQPLFKGVGALLGGNSGGTGIFSEFAASLYKWGGPHADGGPVDSGTTYLVGERGPELFTPSSAGSITPNSQLSSLGSKRGDSFSFTYNIPAGVTRAELLPALQATKNATIAAIMDLRVRGKFA